MRPRVINKSLFIVGVLLLCIAGRSALAINYLFVPTAEYPDIQTAINSPNCVEGDFVIVFADTYDGQTGFYDINFNGKAITLQSFDGPETCIIKPPDGYRAFNFNSGEDANSVLDGFTIEDANVAGYGGAVYCQSSSPTITNCIITGNLAEYGGGIFCTSSSAPTINNTAITDNRAESGGGIYCDSSSLTITNNSKISGNSARSEFDDTYGGGIYCASGSLTVSDSTISDNLSQSDYDWSYGGGIYLGSSSTMTLTNTAINGNKVLSEYESSYGGGIYCQTSSLTVNDCMIAGNLADSNGSGAYGGGIYALSMNLLHVTNSDIASNWALDFGGGFGLLSSPAQITGCAITGNSASSGGGLECSGSGGPIKIESCIISGNQARSGRGGAIDCYASSPIITNSTISSNESFSDSGGGINCETDIFQNPKVPSRPFIFNCIFENNSEYGLYEFDVYSDPVVGNCLFYNNSPDEYGAYGDYWDADTSADYTGDADSNDSINNIPDLFAFDIGGGNPRFVMDGPSAITGTWAGSPDAPYFNSTTKRTVLTDNSASFDVNDLAGRYVNADTAQRLHALIVANGTKTIEVAGDITSYVSAGDTYKIVDYHLSISSSCRDTGDRYVLYGPGSGDLDIDGQLRIIGAGLDIGADEFTADIYDLDFFVSHWLESGCVDSGDQRSWCFGMDMTASRNGRVDFADLANFAVYWLDNLPE